jgi:hypothetical protein
VGDGSGAESLPSKTYLLLEPFLAIIKITKIASAVRITFTVGSYQVIKLTPLDWFQLIKAAKSQSLRRCALVVL